MFAHLQRRALRVLRAAPAPVRETLVRATSPKFTLGTVCRVEHDGQVVLCETEYRDGWGFPGGLIDKGERPDVGGIREVREEVGLDVVLVGEPIVIIDSANRLVDFLYRAVLDSGVDPASARPSSVEIKAVQWVPSDEVLDLIETSLGRPIPKLRYFDEYPNGGLVFHQR